jgi:hypothetical protein
MPDSGLVEICTVVSATYHRRILPEDSVTFCPRPGAHVQAEPELVQDAALTAFALQPSEQSEPNGSLRGTNSPAPMSSALQGVAEVRLQTFAKCGGG